MAQYYWTAPQGKKDTDTGKIYETDKGNQYTIYQQVLSGRYYIVDKNGKVSFFTNPNSISNIDNTKKGGVILSSKINTNDGWKLDAHSLGGSGGSGGGGGGGYVGSTASDDARLEELLNEYKTLIDELKNPKVWTAAELAEKFGLTDLYNMDYLTNMYQDATNKYYNDAIEKQLGYNKDAELSNSAYANSLLKAYLNSYQNAAPTAVGRGTRAANALTTMLGADMSNEASSANLNSIINDYKEQQKADLETDKVLARDYYNDLGNMLLQQGTAINTAEVANYINSLTAYTKAYEGIRNAQNNLASTAASSYQQAAQAALAQNQYNAGQQYENFLRRAYQLNYSGDNVGNVTNAWQKAYDNANTTAALLADKTGNNTYTNAKGSSLNPNKY